MKFLSTLRIALHTLLQNKVRTALTVIIIMVVSFVVVYLFSFLFSLQDSMNENINAMIHKDGVQLSVNVSYQVSENSSYGSVEISLDKVTEILEILDDDSGNFTYIDIHSRASLYYTENGFDVSVPVKPYFASSSPFTGHDNYLVSGRMWKESDFAAGGAFISKGIADAGGLAVGDEVTVTLPSGGEAATFTLCGVFDSEVVGYEKNIAFLDYRHFDGTPAYDSHSGSGGMCISGVTAVLVPQDGVKYGTAFQSYVSHKRDMLEKIEFTDSRLSMNVFSQLLSMMFIISILFGIVFGIITFLCVIIILLSINSVSNTVRISAEQNRKFFGMMKAIGMKNKTMRAILIIQVVIMLIAGVALATGLAFFAVGSLGYFISLIIEQVFYFTGNSFITVTSVSPIVPFITLGLLTLFVILFTRTSLAEVSRMDVITVINEVS